VEDRRGFPNRAGLQIGKAMKWFYELVYSRFRAPWDIGPRKELVEVVENGRIQPCKAIDLGCGTASNAIFLAQHGFDVTGTDFSPAAIALCQQRGAAAGVAVNWIEDDLTELRHVRGQFDFLVDWGVYDDLSLPDRRAYLRNVLPLTHANSRFLIYVHQWQPRWWERPLYRGFGTGPMQPGEVEADFGPHFTIEKLAERVFPSGFIGGEAVYLMTRKGETK
jgi:cyclopropane fatty-acyl-phospholipid synthase-like methyltransferase